MPRKAKVLSDLEVKIMSVIWASDRPVTNSEIAKALEKDGITLPSVAQAVKGLLKKNAVEVQASVPAANVYARTFSPCLTREDYVASEITRIQQMAFPDKRTGLYGIVSALLRVDSKNDAEDGDLEGLRNILEKQKIRLNDHRSEEG